MTDRARLLRLLEDYGRDLMSFALSLLRSRPEAEDACQDMVIQMLRHWHRVDKSRNLKSWTFPITVPEMPGPAQKAPAVLKFLQLSSRKPEARFFTCLKESSVCGWVFLAESLK